MVSEIIETIGYEPNDWSDDFVFYDGENNQILFRVRWEDEELFQPLEKVLKKHKLKYEYIGDKYEIGLLFSFGNKLFYKTKEGVKVSELDDYWGGTTGEVHKKLLKEWDVLSKRHKNKNDAGYY